MNKRLLLPFLALAVLSSARATEYTPIDMSAPDATFPAPSSDTSDRVTNDASPTQTSMNNPGYNPGAASGATYAQPPSPVTQADLGEPAAYPVIKINPEDARHSQSANSGDLTIPLPKQAPVRAYPPFEDDESRLIGQARRERALAESDNPQPAIPRGHTVQVVTPAPAAQDVYLTADAAPLPRTGSKKLAFMLNELVLLHKAAVSAGGDIRVNIETIGIDAEDLIMPLQRQGFFDVEFRPENDRIIIKSKNSENTLLERELADLKEARRRLMDDIATLEGMKNELKDGRSAPPITASPNLSYSPPRSTFADPGTVVLAPRMR